MTNRSRFSLALTLGLAVFVGSAVSDVDQSQRESLLRSLHRERALALQELWVGADAERRELAVLTLQPRADGGRPSGSWPDIEALVDAERALRGGPGPTEGGGWEQRLADSITLVAVPGAFEARGEGRRRMMTVHVIPLFETPANEPIDLRLVWTSPGGDEHTARTEPVRPEHWARGFEMYVTALPSEPGEWSLVPVVLRGAAAYRGLPVAVDAVRDLDRRRKHLEAEGLPELGDPRRTRVLDALAWVRGGMRYPALTTEDALQLAEGEPEGRPQSGLVRATPYFTEGALEAWRTGEPGSKRGVVLVASSRERPEELLAGEVGERWDTLARVGKFEVFATSLPMIGQEALTGEEGRSALELAAHLRVERGWDSVILVAMGDASQLSAVALAAAPETALPDHLVLLRDGPGAARPDRRLDLPVLSVEPLADAAGDEELREEGPAWRRVLRREPRLLVELELPGLVAALFDEVADNDR